MDYVVGGVAALISGNVTPNRPKLIKRAITPKKHQQSPNVTPKCTAVDDRSIFLSPSVQKKKAIVKKSPKRIFQNPDLDTTNDSENNNENLSPKVDKVKKHLKEDLDNDKSQVSVTTMKLQNSSSSIEQVENLQSSNENTPKKKKNKKSFKSEISEVKENICAEDFNVCAAKKSKNKKKKSLVIETVNDFVNNASSIETEQSQPENSNDSPKKKNKKRKFLGEAEDQTTENEKADDVGTVNINNQSKNQITKKKNKKKLKLKSDIENTTETRESENQGVFQKSSQKNKKTKTFVNPNAITDKDSDSEHDSDNDIESDTETANKKVLDTIPNEDESSDEEGELVKKVDTVEKKNAKIQEVNSEEEVKRTIFVGNVPFSKKCKKEIKKIFSKHGIIESVRIRTVPVKDARVTPKLAVIKNELHPDRSTVNVYVKFLDISSVEKALTENNTKLNNNHLRVTRSATSGAEHDPKTAIFVGNLPIAIEDETLRAKFEKCGDIESVRIIRDRKTNAGKGFGYVNFTSKDSVELALQLPEEDLTIKNRIIRVKRCTQLTPKTKNYPKQTVKGTFNRARPGQQDRNIHARQGQRNGNIHARQGQRDGNTYARQGQRDGSYQGRQNQGNNQFARKGQNEGEGAYRRLMNKRNNQENAEGPPQKRQRINQPGNEKKARKEFVGMTAEKKKKHKFNKGQKKKKVLSEILTKKQ